MNQRRYFLNIASGYSRGKRGMERETSCAYGTPRKGRELSHEVTRPRLRAERCKTERLPGVNDIRQLPRPQKPLLCICRSVRHTPSGRFQRKRFRVSLSLESEQATSNVRPSSPLFDVFGGVSITPLPLQVHSLRTDILRNKFQTASQNNVPWRERGSRLP